ncbi:MAG: cupin domain-containing protein [Nitrospirota bacterium]
MTDERSDAELDRATLHALGALEGDEFLQFKRLLADEGAAAQRAREDLASFEPIAARLGETVPPVTPPGALKATILEKIQRTGPEPPLTEAGFTFIRSSEGPWVEPLTGLQLKVLHVDPITQRTTALAKFAPGFRYVSHRHAEIEELFVLEGGFVCQGQALLPGDYHRSDAGSVHAETSTDEGCTLLMIFSPRNEAVGSFAARLSSNSMTLLLRFSALLSRLARRFARSR